MRNSAFHSIEPKFVHRLCVAVGLSLSYNWPVQCQFTISHLSKYAKRTAKSAKALPTVKWCERSLTTHLCLFYNTASSGHPSVLEHAALWSMLMFTRTFIFLHYCSKYINNNTALREFSFNWVSLRNKVIKIIIFLAFYIYSDYFSTDQIMPKLSKNCPAYHKGFWIQHDIESHTADVCEYLGTLYSCRYSNTNLLFLCNGYNLHFVTGFVEFNRRFIKTLGKLVSAVALQPEEHQNDPWWYWWSV